MTFGRSTGLDVEATKGGPHLVHRDHPPGPSAWRRASEPRTVHFAVGGPTADADAAALCDRLRAALDRHRVQLVVCDVGAVTAPDLGTVDALARLQLTARRLGCKVRLDGASDTLRELLALAGLREVVPCWAGSDLEAGGQAKGREEARGVEEERDPPNATS